MNDMPLVSVIIPSYNHAQYIETAIESVLAQTYANIELIIVDDGSQDDSHAVIGHYAQNSNITLILNTKNHGQSHAFNKALKVAKGSFIQLLPSDDWYLPEKTALQVAKFQASAPDVGVVYAAGQRFFDDTGETREVKMPVHTGWVAEKLITEGNFVYPVTPMFRREVFTKVPLHEGFKAEGEAAYIRFALHFKFEYVDRIVAVMRDHSYNIGKDAEVMYDEISRYWAWFFARPDLPESIRRLEPVALEKLNRIKGMQFIGDKRLFVLGRSCLVKAIRYKPTLVFRPKILGALMLSCIPERMANALLNQIKSPKI